MRPSEIRLDSPRNETKAPLQVRDLRGLRKSGEKILEFMSLNKVKGNFRDYVLFVNNQMYDAWGVYTVARADTSEPAAVVALIHKSKLHKVIGDAYAAKFWHRRTGRRTSAGSAR